MATLVVISGPCEGQKFALEEHRLAMVGRDHSCTFQVLDRRVSRYHLQIKGLDDGHAALDFESSNGVYVNGKRLEDVGSPPDAAVHQHRASSGDSVYDLGERFDGRDHAIYHHCPVVRDHDAARPMLNTQAGIVAAEDALDHNGQ